MGGNPTPNKVPLLPSTFILNAFIITPSLCSTPLLFLGPDAKGFLTVVFNLLQHSEAWGDRVTFVLKESHDFPGKTQSPLLPMGFPSILILNI